MLLLQAQLAVDGAPSDRLVVTGAGASASGFTAIAVANVGGAGAPTLGDGILVVEAANGATTAPTAFGLAGSASAGAFEYFLFRGDAAGAGDSWYLRSTLPPAGVAPVAGSGSRILPPGPGIAPPNPGATPVVSDEPVPLYRPEVPLYAVVPPLAHHLLTSTLGTFHERRGDQSLLAGGGLLPASWGRVFGQDDKLGWEGDVDPSFDGSLWGLQAGTDLFGWESASGHQDRFGLFVAYASMSGEVSGQAVGWNDLLVGHSDLNSTSVGATWTHVGPQGWYLDGVAMATWFGGDASSDRGLGIDTDGTGVALSLEGGYPIPLTPAWSLEPQAQLIWHRVSLDDRTDLFGDIAYDADDGTTGRVGLRLAGKFELGRTRLRPYLKADLWHEFGGSDTVAFNGFPIVTDREGTAFGFGGGLVADITSAISLYASADYTTAASGEDDRIFEGNLGVSIKW